MQKDAEAHDATLGARDSERPPAVSRSVSVVGQGYRQRVAYDAELADRIRLLTARERPPEKKMFGGLAFLIGGNMSVAASGQGGLMVRVEPEATEALLREPGAELFEMRGRSMQGWLRVQGEALDDDEVLATWVRRGVTYAKSLPAK